MVKVDVSEGWMLYNTTTGGIVFVHKADDLKKTLPNLIEMRYFVPQEFDEVKWVDELRSTKKSASREDAISGYTILTTLDCNARCFYCYEKGLPRIAMTEKIANDVADFVIKTSSNAPIDIRWFGGEPLTNANAIDIICKALINNSTVFKSSIITNGLLFTDSMIIKAKQLWKLKRVQITLDGTKDVYQKSKSYKGAIGNEFDRVIDNITKLVEANIHVSIRLNQDLYNTSDLLELTDFLSNKFGGNKLVSVYNYLLFEENDKSDARLKLERYKCFIQLQEKLIKYGFLRSKPLNKKLRFRHCMADNDSSVVIFPRGDVGKCEHFSDQNFVGSIYDSKFDYSEILKWKEQYQPTQKCFECPLYPQCVRIKMCPEERESCSLNQCENKIDLIKKALLQKYQSCKNHQD